MNFVNKLVIEKFTCLVAMIVMGIILQVTSKQNPTRINVLGQRTIDNHSHNINETQYVSHLIPFLVLCWVVELQPVYQNLMLTAGQSL